MGTGGFVTAGGGRVERGGGGAGGPRSRFAGDAVATARSFRFDGLAGAVGISCAGLRLLSRSGFGPGEALRD
jgi:hypothetical protein